MTPLPPLELVILPLLTLLSLAFSMWSGREGERVVYARVWGGPPVNGLALRLQVIEEEGGLQRGLAGQTFSVEAQSSSGASVREARTVEDGWVDVVLPLAGSDERARLAVTGSTGMDLPLASGPIAWSSSAWADRATRVSGLVAADPNAQVPVGFRFEPPVFSAPFPGDVVLELSPAKKEPLSIRVEIAGARLLSSPQLTLEPGQPERVRLEPLEHSIALTAAIDGPAGPLRRTVTIPVRAGSLTAHARGDHLIISSPVPRARAYYSVVTPRGR